MYKEASVFNFITAFFRTGSIIKSSFLPNSEKSDKSKYDLKITGSYSLVNVGDIVIIDCKPKSNKKPYFKGQICINTTSNNILKVSGTYFQERSKGNAAKFQSYTYEVNFKEDAQGALTLDNLTLNIMAKIKLHKFEDEVLLSNISDYAKPINGLIGINTNQVAIMKNNYNEAFWNKNQPIKYTNAQKEVIAEFNKKGKFISNFLK